MAKVVKMCNMTGDIASQVFSMLNPSVQYTRDEYGNKIIITDTQPSELIYPEGWYYAKGKFRNKHQSTTGIYSEIYMMTSSGDLWGDSAKYCTLSD